MCILFLFLQSIFKQRIKITAIPLPYYLVGEAAEYTNCILCRGVKPFQKDILGMAFICIW